MNQPLPAADAARVVGLARAWIGTPYHHQASTRHAGTDCLGLIRGVWRDLYGVEAEQPAAYSRDWGEAGGIEPMLEAASRHLIALPVVARAPGHVLLFRIRPHAAIKHAAIQATDTTMIHATEHRAVAEVPLTRWWRGRLAAVFAFPERLR